ncbi:MAG TPA: response regulator, partial [Polyangiales bacterium]
MSEKIKRTVVIAEDDLEVAQVLGRIVRALGHTTLIAHDGAEALEILRNNKADLLLSDIDMPRMDGITLLSHAR